MDLDGEALASAGLVTMISERTPALLRVGGPLTNSVSVNRRGKILLLNYELVGAGGVLVGAGGAYQLVNPDRLHPPEFVIYQGDKKVASGKFEFG